METLTSVSIIIHIWRARGLSQIFNCGKWLQHHVCLTYQHEHHNEKHVFIIDWNKVTDHVIFMSQTHLNEPQKTKTWDLSKLTEKCVWSSDSRWIYEVQLLFSELNVFSFQVLFCSAGPFQPSSPDPQPYTVSSYWDTVCLCHAIWLKRGNYVHLS